MVPNSREEVRASDCSGGIDRATKLGLSMVAQTAPAGGEFAEERRSSASDSPQSTSRPAKARHDEAFARVARLIFDAT
jgi:hypothetical protein